MSVLLMRSGNWVTLSPTSSSARRLIAPLLTFTVRQQLAGKERAMAKKNRLPLVEEGRVEAFIDDHKGRITFQFGYIERVVAALVKANIPYRYKHLTPPERPEVFAPQWERVWDGDTELRYRQDEFLRTVALYENGRFDCPTGYGKSHLIELIARMWPRARIAIVSDTVTVIRDRIFPQLCLALPSVGIVGGGMRQRGQRVMCFTADSLRWLFKDSEERGNFDALIFDEVHLAVADGVAGLLASVPGQPRMYGLSATHDMRWDGKDFRAEGLFGPVRFKMSYEEARLQGIVVPMQVIARKVVLDSNPAGGYAHEEKQRHGVWRNKTRNDMIVEDAVSYAALGKQTMITCSHLEHVLNIKKCFDHAKEMGRVPAGLDLLCVYRQHDSTSDHAQVLEDMKRQGVGDVFKALPFMSPTRRLYLTRAIADGKVPLFVGTTILNVGFDPKDLRVVVRADAGSSQIADTQWSGRNSRPSEGKVVGIVRDYVDQFDRGLLQRWHGRLRSYRGLKWDVRVLGGDNANEGED